MIDTERNPVALSEDARQVAKVAVFLILAGGVCGGLYRWRSCGWVFSFGPVIIDGIVFGALGTLLGLAALAAVVAAVQFLLS